MADLLCSTIDGVDVVTVGADLDVYTSPSLREVTENPELLARRRLVIDLTATEFVDSTGLGVLLGALRRIEAAGGSMGVACMRESILHSIRVLGLDKMLKVYDTLDEAIAAVKGEDGG